MHLLPDLRNCIYYLAHCGRPEDLHDYEEKLLEKCFDNTYYASPDIGHTQYCYEPPFGLDIKNTS
jgi:hypothetical protein